MGQLYDNALELRDVADGAETATAAETGIAFDIRSIGQYEAVVFITAIDDTTDDESYVFTIEADTAAAVTAAVVLATRTVDNGVTVPYEFRIPLSGPLAETLTTTEGYVRVKATLGGTTPSVTYGAYLTAAGGREGTIADRD